MQTLGLWLEPEVGPDISVQPEAVRALLTMMAAKHQPTYLHLFQVASYTEALARRVGLSEAEVKAATTAALLHDVGKVAIPDGILTKPGRLTDAEMELMITHAEWGATILAKTGGMEHLLDAVRHHHEWYNGSGYPAGLSGQAIPLYSRMIGITDAFDTMTTPRAYRRSLSVEGALIELKRCSGTQFDPDLVRPFVEELTEQLRSGVTRMHRPAVRGGARPEQTEPLAVRLARASLQV